jgi:actin related protein 2/3 complex subunit 1A/1B
VFQLEGNEWKPTLVILRLDRAATCVVWSPKEDKFAVGTGSKAISICYFDTENSWWVSKHIRGEKSGITSTIKCLTWHPNNIILAAGGTDCSVHVYSTFVKGIDNRKDVAAGTPFGSKLPWATLLATFPTSAWLHDIAFSPSGFQLAWVTHDSVVGFLDCATENHRIQNLRTSGLPFQTVIWAGENTLIAAGHDCNPAFFQGGAMNYSFRGYVNKVAKQAGGQNQSAAKIWQQRSGMGTTNASELENTLPTAHQNAITQVRAVSPTSFSSVGNDGQLAIWTYSKVGVNVQ